jgi:hypothetical protein
MLLSYLSQGPSKFNRISDGPQNGVKMIAPDIDELLFDSVQLAIFVPKSINVRVVALCAPPPSPTLFRVKMISNVF